MFNLVLSSGIVGIGVIDPNGTSVQVVGGSGVVPVEVDSFDPVVKLEITVRGVTVLELVDVDEFGNENPNVGFAWDWLDNLKRFKNWSNPSFTSPTGTGAVGAACATWETGITWGTATDAGLYWIYLVRFIKDTKLTLLDAT